MCWVSGKQTWMMLTFTVIVIIDGIVIIILLFKNVSFSALLFPTIFFINVSNHILVE